MTTSGSSTHDEVREHLAEYALGVLDGRERAAVLAHVEACADCAEESRSLAAAADTLVMVPVAVDPPLGFESRVVERIRSSAARSGRSRWGVPRLAAAAAIVAVAFAVGWGVEHATSTPGGGPAHSVIERQLVASGRSVGLVYVDTGRPTWMFVSLDVPGAPAKVVCEVVTRSGLRERVGTFTLADGHGAWGATLAVPWSQVRAVDITSTSGVRLAALGSSTWSNPTSAN